MSDQKEFENDVDDTEKQKDKTKVIRQRKKSFYNAIRKQMEFYFGDANLSKDRFLMKLIREDPYVPLDVFLQFNKMKQLVSSVEEIAKSLRKSELLELDENRTKVRRTTTIQEDRNADGQTIYIENLPPNADHDWIKNVFSRYGEVEYVSLPRFKHSKKIKGFGFVEFKETDNLEKAINHFHTFNAVMNITHTAPSELRSITTYAEDQEEIKKSTSNDDEKTLENIEIVSKNTDESEPSAKRIKLDTDTEAENQLQIVEDSEEMEVSQTSPKKKRKKVKSKNLKKSFEMENDVMHIRIMPKSIWKYLRNKYLNLQRQKYAELKQMMRNSTNRNANAQNTRKFPMRNTHNINFYGANQEQNSNSDSCEKDTFNSTKINKALTRKPLFEYMPGIIICIKFKEPCVDIKSYKAEMRCHQGICYVDVKEGSTEAYIRCENSDVALNFTKQVSTDYTCQILSGEAESSYWKKIMKDREMKFSKVVKIKSTKIKDQITKIQPKQHVRFDEE